MRADVNEVFEELGKSMYGGIGGCHWCGTLQHKSAQTKSFLEHQCNAIQSIGRQIGR